MTETNNERAETETGSYGTNTLISLRSGRNTFYTSPFGQHLAKLGGTRDQIKHINELIGQLVTRANIKQEDMTDKLSLLKKVEVKIHQLVELRTVFAFFDPKTLYAHEKEIKDKINQENYKNRRDRDMAAWRAEAAKRLAKIKKKRDLVVIKNIRNVERSTKPELQIMTNVVVKTPPEIE